MSKFEWDSTDVYLSNKGKGPLHARILYVVDGIAQMERWARDQSRAVRFKLPVKYLTSDRCGWRLVP